MLCWPIFVVLLLPTLLPYHKNIIIKEWGKGKTSTGSNRYGCIMIHLAMNAIWILLNKLYQSPFTFTRRSFIRIIVILIKLSIMLTMNLVSALIKIEVDWIKYGLEIHAYYLIYLPIISYNGWKTFPRNSENTDIGWRQLGSVIIYGMFHVFVVFYHCF